MSLFAIGDLHLHFQSELKAPGQLKDHGIPVTLLCDTNHQLTSDQKINAHNPTIRKRRYLEK